MMLTIAGILLVATAPCAFWVWLVIKGDRYQPEPKLQIIKIFFLGAAVAIPVAIIESILHPSSLQSQLSVPIAAYVSFGVAGITEEVAKFLTVRMGVYRSRYFNEPSDGLVYAAAAALGFAFAENVVYIIEFGWQVILLRGMFSNLAHVLFSVLWGYPLVLTKLGLKSKIWVWFGLIGAIGAHGFFDFLLLTQSAFTWLVIPFFLVMIVVLLLMLRHSNRISQFNPNRS
jgi:RsiW-degrading membrane proteinase PrsW (M82 family)